MNLNSKQVWMLLRHCSCALVRLLCLLESMDKNASGLTALKQLTCGFSGGAKLVQDFRGSSQGVNFCEVPSTLLGLNEGGSFPLHQKSIYAKPAYQQ